jgi:hypothetical protein
MHRLFKKSRVFETTLRGRSVRAFAGVVLAAATLLFSAAPARAQSIVKQPGNHERYSLELDPHLVAQYADLPFTDAGVGLGMRFSIPFVHNGPISTINNNIGISFGLDWVHFGDDGICNTYGYTQLYPNTCSANELWFPVAAQWNFFLTRVISVFGEFGLSPHWSSWGYAGPCAGGGTCEYHTSHLDMFEPVVWGGGRFLFSRKLGMTVRLGWPYISVGMSILL